MSALDLLTNLNTLDEHERIEAKRASEVGKSLLESVCAFANEPGLGGGNILLGVVQDELSLFLSYEVIGIPNPDQVSRDLATQCRDTFNVPVRVQITTDQIDGKAVIVVTVPEAPASDKPVFFKATGLPRGAFRRIGSTDQRCTDDDIAILYEGRGQESFDKNIVVDASLADISDEALADYRSARKEANANAEELRWSDQELLQSLGAIRQVAPNDSWKPTVAGLILFGTRQALRRCFPMTRVDYIRVPGKEWIPDPDRRFETVEMRDPLFKLIRRAQAAVQDDLPLSFRLDEGELQRVDTPIIPLRVLREAIVNALMHRNYRNSAPVQIIRYANRLELRNPGFSLKSPDHLGDPGSLPRNPTIAAVLHETRFAETKGSGIRVMREMMEKSGLTPPVFDSDRGRDEFIAGYLFHHFLGDGDVAWLSHFRDLHLAAEDARVLIFVREIGFIDNARCRELTHHDTLAASQTLRKLRDAGLLDRKGKGSATYYVPGPRLLAANRKALDESSADIQATVGADDHLGLSRDSASVPRNPDRLSRDLRELPRNSDTLSRKQGQISRDPNSEEARTFLMSRLPKELASRASALGERGRPDQIKALLTDMLAAGEWQLAELGLALRRNPEYIRSTYLKGMMESGQAEMTHPTDPNHPQQSYRAPRRTS